MAELVRDRVALRVTLALPPAHVEHLQVAQLAMLQRHVREMVELLLRTELEGMRRAIAQQPEPMQLPALELVEIVEP